MAAAVDAPGTKPSNGPAGGGEPGIDPIASPRRFDRGRAAGGAAVAPDDPAPSAMVPPDAAATPIVSLAAKPSIVTAGVNDAASDSMPLPAWNVTGTPLSVVASHNAASAPIARPRRNSGRAE
jgi:hypothetical protein